VLLSKIFTRLGEYTELGNKINKAIFDEGLCNGICRLVFYPRDKVDNVAYVQANVMEMLVETHEYCRREKLLGPVIMATIATREHLN
jgi:hypothetical protein